MKIRKEKLSLFEIISMFPDDATAEQWFIGQRWANGVCCPTCASDDLYERVNARNKKAWKCKNASCRREFSTRTGTPMEGSNLGFKKWLIAVFLLTTNIKGIASTKLASDLGITQKTAWHLAMRIREAYKEGKRDMLGGIVEIDETYLGGKEKNKHANKRTKGTQGRSTLTKTAVIGARQRGGGIKAQMITKTDSRTMKGFIHDNVQTGSTVYTDNHRGYTGLGGLFYKHKSVNHSAREYVNGMAHTNGIESFWALLKRGYYGTHHHMSHKHISRYVNEFSGRFNIREIHTMKAMQLVAKSLPGKTLPYKKLIEG